MKFLRSESETSRYGRGLARTLRPGDVVLLLGDLGSGKTTLTKGVARGLGIRTPITSPTFVLRKRYALPHPVRGIRFLNHVDAYRLGDAKEFRGVLDQMIAAATDEVWCIEWGGKIRSALQSTKTRLIRLRVVDSLTRAVTGRLVK